MFVFTEMSLLEKIKRLYPPYRRRRDEAMLAAIRQLVASPEMPCKIGDTYIRDGLGAIGGPR